MPSLRELQSDFLEAILGAEATLGSGASNAAASPVPAAVRLAREIVGDASGIAERLAIYANNAEHHYLESLRKSFPVVRRLVGEDYFTQCAREFRRDQPSRSGDLHDLGGPFPTYWHDKHGDDAYRYLGDVARLEWLYQEASTAADHAPFDFAKLARVSPADYDALRFCLHPAMRLFASEFPALAIWEANLRSDQEPEIIDLRGGGVRLLIVRRAEGIVLRPLTAGEFVFLDRIAQSDGFAAAVAAAEEADPEFDAAKALEKFVRENVIVDLVVPQ
jgi:hypothetical protein